MPDDEEEERELFTSAAGALFVELPISPDWKRDVAKRLKAMHQEQKDLAAHIGCSQANVSQTLSLKRRKQKTSKFAHAISLATQVPLPVEALSALLAVEAIQVDRQGYTEVIRGLARAYKLKIV